MLMEWMKQRDDGEVKKPIVSTRKRRKLVKKEEVEEDKLAEGNSLPEVRASLSFAFLWSSYRLCLFC